jgi:quercetin dioxygenase-like cupin family protein
VTAVAEFQPGATVGRHTHPGEEIGYILEGMVVIEQEGQQPVALGPGKTFFIPAGTIHNATNKTSKSAAFSPTTSSNPGSRSPRRSRQSNPPWRTASYVLVSP